MLRMEDVVGEQLEGIVTPGRSGLRRRVRMVLDKRHPG